MWVSALMVVSKEASMSKNSNFRTSQLHSSKEMHHSHTLPQYQRDKHWRDRWEPQLPSLCRTQNLCESKTHRHVHKTIQKEGGPKWSLSWGFYALLVTWAHYSISVKHILSGAITKGKKTKSETVIIY